MNVKIGYQSVLAVVFIFAFSHTLRATPNVLLIYVDDLGYGDLASYGHPVLKTPYLDRLASEGLRLTSYYAPSALCSPSRAGLLTGRTPYRTGIQSWIPANSGVYLRDREITLAELLKGAGYSTALIGKWHLNSDLASMDEPQPTEQGFDYFYGHNAFQIPTNKDPVNVFRGKKALGVQKGYTAELYASEAINWLDKRDTTKPFFLMLSTAEPHTTFENPDAYNQMYTQFTRGEIIPIPSGEKEIPREKLVARGPGEYYANVSYMDAQIGRVLSWLRDNNAEEDTLVVFTSDNGPVTSDWFQWFEVNAYGSTGGYKGRKHFLHEGGIRVPAIVRFPGHTQAGTVSNVPVIGTDWFTTIAGIAGVEIPPDRVIDGRDILPVLSGRDLDKKILKRDLFWALPPPEAPQTAGQAKPEFALRSDDWKMLLDSDHQPVELYNLVEDPLELINLLGDNPKQAERLEARFVEILRSIETDALRPHH